MSENHPAYILWKAGGTDWYQVNTWHQFWLLRSKINPQQMLQHAKLSVNDLIRLQAHSYILHTYIE